MDVAKQIALGIIIPLVVGFGGAVLGAYVAVPVLDIRVDNVERDAQEAKDIAKDAHRRINHFHAGG